MNRSFALDAASLALLAVIVWLVLVLIGHVRAERMPVPKNGNCPSGYRERGGYCAPTSDRVAVPKRGQCPSGFASEAHYCVEMR